MDWEILPEDPTSLDPLDEEQRQIIDRLAIGDTWAWCTVTCTVYCEYRTGTYTKRFCSFKNAAAFHKVRRMFIERAQKNYNLDTYSLG